MVTFFRFIVAELMRDASFIAVQAGNLSMRMKFRYDIRERTTIRTDSRGLGRETLQGRGKESQTCTAFRSWLKINQFKGNQCNFPSKNLELSCVSLTTKNLLFFAWLRFWSLSRTSLVSDWSKF